MEARQQSIIAPTTEIMDSETGSTSEDELGSPKNGSDISDKGPMNDVDHCAYTVNFHDIVKKGKPHSKESLSHMFVGHFIESVAFRMGILLIIIFNSILVGLQTNRYLEEHYGAVLSGLDKFFLTIFMFEIFIKWYYDFLGFWRTGWNIFDFVIVALSFFVPGIIFLSGSRILHVLRILRAIRSLRSISALRGLQIVIQTVGYSIQDMANITVLLLICMFIFAILGNSLFGDNCPEHFGSLESTMFSLFICVTQDGWLKIVEELNMCGSNILGPIYLVIFITIGAFILANLVVAVVVTNLEWVIAEQSDTDQKVNINQDITRLELAPKLSACSTLIKMANYQIPLKIKTKTLDKYLTLLSALEENFTEFKKIKNELIKIQQEVQALEKLDEIGNDELMEQSSDLFYGEEQRNSSFGSGGGDAITEMMAMLQKTTTPIQTGEATSIHQMITQLVHRVPSAQSNSRRSSNYFSEFDIHQSRPVSRPVSRPTSRPMSRPMSRPASRRMSRPVSMRSQYTRHQSPSSSTLATSPRPEP